MATRKSALALFQAAVQTADPKKAVFESRTPSLQGSVCVIAAGKAAPAMLAGLAARVRREGGRIEHAWVVYPKAGAVSKRARVRYLPAEHPLPGRGSARAAREIEQSLASAQAGSLWVLLLSGGASSLLASPREGLSLSDLAGASGALLRSGAPIEEINAVRKHLSRLGGGGMLLAFRGARLATLALSDVPSDRLDTIGSGPGVPDRTTFGECLRIVHKRHLKLPRRALVYLQQGARGLRPETLKRTDPRASARIIGGARRSLRAATLEARRRGFRARNLGVLKGDASVVARAQVKAALKAPRRTCLLSGGELSVQVRGKGRGGRNQEFVLAALCELAKAGAAGRVGKSKNLIIFAAGTDGSDGNTPAAGAWATRETLARAKALGLDPERFLARNDSHTFFKKLGQLVTTGPTGTNVMDFRAILTT